MLLSCKQTFLLHLLLLASAAFALVLANDQVVVDDNDGELASQECLVKVEEYLSNWNLAEEVESFVAKSGIDWDFISAFNVDDQSALEKLKNKGPVPTEACNGLEHKLREVHAELPCTSQVYSDEFIAMGGKLSLAFKAYTICIMVTQYGGN